MKATDYVKMFAAEMGFQIEDMEPLRQILVVKKGDREVLGFTLREIINADNSGHPRNWIEPQFRALACRLAEENQSSPTTVRKQDV